MRLPHSSLSDIAADSPILFIPHAATSKDILVAHLGNLTRKNQILVSGSQGTINAEKSNSSNADEGGNDDAD